MSDLQQDPDQVIRIGISACLLGHKVRFDRGHKQDHYLTDTLGRYFQWVHVCPEVQFGLSIPRPPIRLEAKNGEVRMIVPKEGKDLTEAFRTYAKSQVEALDKEHLCGYVLKKNSPSCGMERVKVYPPSGMPLRTGRGLYAKELLARYPNLPVEEEGRLHDPALRENWVTRVFTYHRLHMFWKSSWKVGDLINFHRTHKLLLLAHSPEAYEQLGRVVARAKALSRNDLRVNYENKVMAALAKMATPAKNTNVLQHIMGHFKKDLDHEAKRELLDHIEDYRHGLVPLVVPLTLVAHYVRLLKITYLENQVYLTPHPKELALRSRM